MATTVSTPVSTHEKLLRSREASTQLAQLSTIQKNAMLLVMAKAIEAGENSILEANRADLESSGLAGPMRDRLLLNAERGVGRLREKHRDRREVQARTVVIERVSGRQYEAGDRAFDTEPLQLPEQLREDALGCLTTSAARSSPSLIPVLSTRAPEAQIPSRCGVTGGHLRDILALWQAPSKGFAVNNPSTPEGQNPQGLTIQHGAGVPDTGPTAADLDHLRTPHAGGRP